MDGGAGNDKLYGDGESDKLYGEAGNDRLWGGAGRDTYYFNGQGFDVINDGVFNSGAARTGTVYDTVDVLSVSYLKSDTLISRVGNSLTITSLSDRQDNGVVDNLVEIQNFFLGGHYVVETLQYGDQTKADLTHFLFA